MVHRIQNTQMERIKKINLANDDLADGKYSHYYYCPYIQCETGPYVYKSIKRCEKNSKGSPCYLFAKGKIH